MDNQEPLWNMTTEETCDELYEEHQNNPDGFMVAIVPYHIRRAQQLLNYKILRTIDTANLQELERIFCYYFEVDAANGLAREAVKRALSKVRSIRRQKIYRMGVSFVGITPDYEKFFYAPHANNHDRLVPYSDETLDTELEVRYYLENQIGIPRIGIPRLYVDLEFIILVVKEEEGIFINFIRPRMRHIRSVFKRQRRI